MQEVYMCPEMEVISFVPGKAIAMEQPGWGWEEDIFSTSEARIIDGENAERRMDDEG